MTVNEKIKAIDNKIAERQTSKILELSSGNVCEYEFLTGQEFLTEKRLLKKAARIKRFEYLLLRSELKKQTDIAKQQY